MNQKLLIITYYYTPVINPRAFRWSALAERWASQGHQVDVVCAWESGFAHEEWLNGVHIFRVHSNLMQSLRYWFKKIGKTSAEQDQSRSVTPSQSKSWFKHKAKAVAQQVYQRVYRKLCWPDAYFFWYTPALKKATELTSRTQYDILISVSPYFTAHLVGRRVHSANSDLRWMVDIGDPFSFLDVDSENNWHLYRGLNHRVERGIFQRADVISVTTQPTLDQYAALFPESAAKIQLIPPLLSLAENEDSSEVFFAPNDKIRLVYTGMLHAGVRRATFLLKLFAALLQTPLADKLELHFLGDLRHAQSDFDPYKTILGEKIFLHGRSGRERVTQAMREATILVNIGNKTSYQLPSKVVEYVSMGKPILNLLQIENDSSALFFSTYPAALNLVDTGDNDFVRQTEILHRFIAQPPPIVAPEQCRDLIAPFKLVSIAASYDRALLINMPHNSPSEEDVQHVTTKASKG